MFALPSCSPWLFLFFPRIIGLNQQYGLMFGSGFYVSMPLFTLGLIHTTAMLNLIRIMSWARLSSVEATQCLPLVKYIAKRLNAEIINISPYVSTKSLDK